MSYHWYHFFVHRRSSKPLLRCCCCCCFNCCHSVYALISLRNRWLIKSRHSMLYFHMLAISCTHGFQYLSLIPVTKYLTGRIIDKWRVYSLHSLGGILLLWLFLTVFVWGFIASWLGDWSSPFHIHFTLIPLTLCLRLLRILHISSHNIHFRQLCYSSWKQHNQGKPSSFPGPRWAWKQNL